jgi:hypothetical protein
MSVRSTKTDFEAKKNQRYDTFLAEGDSLMNLNLFPEAAKKYYNAILFYTDDSTSRFAYAKALVECCSTESTHCQRAMMLLSELKRRYPKSPMLLAWERQMQAPHVPKPRWRIKATLNTSNS